MLARKENFVEHIDPEVRDKWDIPVLENSLHALR